MKKLLGLAWILGFAGFTAACSDDDQETTPVVTNDTIKITVHVMEGGTDKGSKDISTLTPIEVASTITDKEGKTTTEQHKGIRASDVIQSVLGLADAAALDTYLGKYTCEFESNQDGVKSSKGKCKDIVIPCTTMKHAYFDTQKGGIFYDSEATFLENGAAVAKETWQAMGCLRTSFVSDDKAGDNPAGGKYQANIDLTMTLVE